MFCQDGTGTKVIKHNYFLVLDYPSPVGRCENTYDTLEEACMMAGWLRGQENGPKVVGVYSRMVIETVNEIVAF